MVGIFRHDRISQEADGLGSAINLNAFGLLFRNRDDEGMAAPMRLHRFGLDRRGERVGGLEHAFVSNRSAYAEMLSGDIDLGLLGIEIGREDADFIVIRMIKNLRVLEFVRHSDAAPSRDEHLVEKLIECPLEIEHAGRPLRHRRILATILMRDACRGRGYLTKFARTAAPQHAACHTGRRNAIVDTWPTLPKSSRRPIFPRTPISRSATQKSLRSALARKSCCCMSIRRSRR